MKPVLWRGAVWLGANIAVAAAGMNIERVPGGGALAVLALLTVLVVFNIVFLLAPRMGLDEEGAIAHRHIRYEDRLFGRLYGERNISSARNPWIVGIATVAFVIQLATLLHLGEEYFQVGWVEVKESTGLRLADMSIALLTSTVLHNVMFGLPDKIFIVKRRYQQRRWLLRDLCHLVRVLGFCEEDGGGEAAVGCLQGADGREGAARHGRAVPHGPLNAARRDRRRVQEHIEQRGARKAAAPAGRRAPDVHRAGDLPGILSADGRAVQDTGWREGDPVPHSQKAQVRRIRPDENHRSHFKCATGQGAGNRRR